MPTLKKIITKLNNNNSIIGQVQFLKNRDEVNVDKVKMDEYIFTSQNTVRIKPIKVNAEIFKHRANVSDKIK